MYHPHNRNRYMRIILLLTAFAATFCHTAIAQVGQPFPALTGLTLDGQTLTLPNDTQEKYTLVGMAFGQKAEAALKTWYNPVYQTFIQEKTGAMAAFAYDVNVYFIPMFTGVKQGASKQARKKALQKVQPELHPHVLFYKGTLDAYKESLDMTNKKTPYFFVIDTNGNVVYATTGAYSKAKMEEVEEIVGEL